MIKTILLVGASVLAILVFIPIAILVGSDMRSHKLVPKLTGAQTPVAAKVPLSVARVRARLDDKLNGGVKMNSQSGWTDIKRPDIGPQFADATVKTNENGSIDFGFRYTQTGMSSDAPISTGPLDLETQDPGLTAYLKLPVAARPNDLLIHTLVPSQINPSVKWTTPDFADNGQLLPYTSSYFLHLEATKSNETEITVLGYDAQIVKGQRWSVVGDMFFAPPHRIENVVAVPPSPADKAAMLDLILGLLK